MIGSARKPGRGNAATSLASLVPATGPVWDTKQRYFSPLNTLGRSLVIPEGKALAAPSGSGSHQVFVCGKLTDFGAFGVT